MFSVRLTLSKAIFLTCFTLREKCPDLELFWSECRKIRTRITPNTYTFYAMLDFELVALRAIFWENLTKWKSSGSFAQILLTFGYFVQMDKKSYCQCSFEKNLVVTEIRGLEIWPNSSQNYFLKQENIFWFNLRLDWNFNALKTYFLGTLAKVLLQNLFFQNLKMFTFLEIMTRNQENLEFRKTSFGSNCCNFDKP